jgi:hypothetical protein
MGYGRKRVIYRREHENAEFSQRYSELAKDSALPLVSHVLCGEK